MAEATVPRSARSIIEIRDLRKVYRREKQELVVLDGINLDVPDGAFEALMGPSGSGKTTLLNLIAGIDSPTSGSIKVAGEDIARLGEGDRARWRARNIGFIFQFYNLMPVLTAAENVELPLLLTKLSKAERRKRVEIALRLVALQDRMDHTPRQLSGGQQQRVAIARAIVADPQIIVADEAASTRGSSRDPRRPGAAQRVPAQQDALAVDRARHRHHRARLRLPPLRAHRLVRQQRGLGG